MWSVKDCGVQFWLPPIDGFGTADDALYQIKPLDHYKRGFSKLAYLTLIKVY